MESGERGAEHGHCKGTRGRVALLRASPARAFCERTRWRPHVAALLGSAGSARICSGAGGQAAQLRAEHAVGEVDVVEVEVVAWSEQGLEGAVSERDVQESCKGGAGRGTHPALGTSITSQAALPWARSVSLTERPPAMSIQSCEPYAKVTGLAGGARSVGEGSGPASPELQGGGQKRTASGCPSSRPSANGRTRRARAGGGCSTRRCRAPSRCCRGGAEKGKRSISRTPQHNRAWGLTHR